MNKTIQDGFDLFIGKDGDLTADEYTHEMTKVDNNENRLQLALSRIKSVEPNWYKDNVGANLELLVGRPCTEETAETGKQMIRSVLIMDELWADEEFVIISDIDTENRKITYTIYFKITEETIDAETAFSVNVEIDLIRGIVLKNIWQKRGYINHATA